MVDHRGAIVLLAVVMLAGCGGDAEATPPPTSSPVATVTVTATAPAPTPSATDPATPADVVTSAPEAPAPEAGVVQDDRARLDVDGQRGDGREIRVKDVRLGSGTGFVAIFAPGGALLGSAPVRGDARRFAVRLATPVTQEAEYLALLYGDDGDGRLDLSADPVVVRDGGETVSARFPYRLR